MVQVQRVAAPVRNDRIVRDVAAQELIGQAADRRGRIDDIAVERPELELLIAKSSDGELATM